MDDKPQAKLVTAEELLKILRDLEGQPVTRLAIYGYCPSFGDDPAKWPEAGRGPHCYQIRGLDDTLLQAITRLSQLHHLLLAGVQLTASQMWSVAENLTQLASLNVSGNHFGDDGALAIAENLSQLTSLSVEFNEIGDAGALAIAENLSQLTSLSVEFNEIGDAGARAIAERLIQLTSLVANRNSIGDAGAQVIAENLTQLTSLAINRNQIGDAGAKAIAENLTQITSLDVRDNGIGEAGARAIAENLSQLTSLHIGRNRIGHVGARAIAEYLFQLTSLNIWDNQIGVAGALAIAQNLSQLTSLSIGFNKIGDVGARAIAENLPQLTSLYIESNQVGDAGARAIAENLTQLTSLIAGRNGIGDAGARAIAENLTQLTTLNLETTAVTSLEPFAARILAGWPVVSQSYYFDEGLNPYDCPLVTPSLEIVSQGPEAVRNYFREVAAQGIDRLYEAKVLILGQGGAGKTSLLRRLYQPQLGLPDQDQTTKGIDVHRHDFPGNHGKDFRLNVWDFGGQQIYHATHQFFLTRSSLYILVDDTRQDDKSVQDEGFKFWLEVVDTLGDGSPLLIFQNEKGGRSKPIDEPGIRQHFPNYKDKFSGDLNAPASVDQLRKAIEYHVQRLPHVGVEVPAKWVTVRAAVEEVAKQKPYLTQQEYFDLYGKHLEFDREKALFLSRYFHNLGVFLHFQDDRLLKKTVILQNQWATEAVFKVLDNEAVKAAKGRFTRDDCERLWAESRYADMHDELLGLMEKFELCYELPARGEWLAPQLLSPSKPADLANWARPSDLVLRFKYTFLPKGLISRLMVRQHRFVKQLDKCWVHGALFEHEGTVVIVEESGSEIAFRARGPEVKALLSVLSSDLEALNESFKGLKDKVSKRVPCICSSCRQTVQPEMYDHKMLVRRKEKNQLTKECDVSFEDVSVLSMLEGLRLDQLPKWAKVAMRKLVDDSPDGDEGSGLQAAQHGGVSAESLSANEINQRRAAAERQVCAILAGGHFIGTAVLVGEKRILTNRHVHDRAFAADPSLNRWEAVFDYAMKSQQFDKLKRVPIHVPAPLISSPDDDLDYAFLDLKEAPDGDRGALVAFHKTELRAGMPMRVLTYRGGEPTQGGIARPLPQEERIGAFPSIDVKRGRFSHNALTTPGSSGSPVFTEAFQWIGLHHEGKEGHGNHAILMSAIWKDLARQNRTDYLKWEAEPDSA